MAFWDRVRDNIGWERDRNDDRDRWLDRGGWSGRDRDYDRPYDRGYGTDYRDMSSNRGRGNYGGDYNDRNYGSSARHFNDDIGHDRWSSGRMGQGSYDDYDRGGWGMERGGHGGSFGDRSGFSDRGGFSGSSNYGGPSYGGGGDRHDRDRDRDRNRGYRGSAGGADFDRGSYGYDFGERHTSGRFSGGTTGRGNYDRTDFDFDRDRDRDRWRDDRDDWDRSRNRW